MKRLIVVLLGCLYFNTLGLAGQVQENTQLQSVSAANAEIEKRAKAAGPAPLAFQVGPGDVLSVRVFQVPDLTGDYVVEFDGTLVLPFVADKIPVQGKTPGQIAAQIRALLQARQLVNDPQVQVAVREQHSGSVSIIGAVRMPTVFQASYPTGLTAALAKAGGLADDAGDVVIIRRQSGSESSEGKSEPRTITVDLSRLLSGQDASLDVPIVGGDTITVPRAGMIYVLGAVQRPGGFPMKSGEEQITVLKALALAGDLKPTARPQKSAIIRRDAKGLEVSQSIDAARILAGKAPNSALRANDILFVPDSTTKKAVRRAAESIVQVLTGVVIYRR